MNQIKIGKFIAECRRKNNLTQKQLAERLNITDRAISKWENGRGMPDSAIMLELCNELKISVNELLSGEMINVKENNENAEENLYELNKNNEKNRKIIIVGITIIIVLVIISIIELFLAMVQFRNTQIQTEYEIYTRVNDLEKRINCLEQTNIE